MQLPLTRSILKNVGPIRHCEPPHADSPGVASGTVARRLRIEVHDNDNDKAWQRGPLWPHGMGPIKHNSHTANPDVTKLESIVALVWIGQQNKPLYLYSFLFSVN